MEEKIDLDIKDTLLRVYEKELFSISRNLHSQF